MLIKSLFSLKRRIDELILGGSGAFNKYIRQCLQEYLKDKLSVKTHDDYNVPSKYKEAIAFAILAYATYNHIPNNVKTAKGSEKSVVLGNVTFRRLK